MDWTLQSKEIVWLNELKDKWSNCMLPIRDSLRLKDTHIGWNWRDGKMFHVNGKQKRAGVALLISDKIDSKWNIVTRDKEG